MSASVLRLFVDANFVSPYAMTDFVALHEKKLTFDVVPVDLAARENYAPDFTSRSRTSRVPTLQHDDFSLSESSAIAEYVDEVFPGVLLYPRDVREKAKARQVQAWLRSDLMPIREERSTEVVFRQAKMPPLSANGRAAAERLFQAAEMLLPKDAAHVCGEWSLADVDLALMINRLALHGDAVPARLAAYAAQQWLRPSVQLWVNHPRRPVSSR